MRFLLLLIVSIGLSPWLAAAQPAPECRGNDHVFIPDENLRRFIELSSRHRAARAGVERKNDRITCRDMEAIEELTLLYPVDPVSTLEGLEHASNLSSLTLGSFPVPRGGRGRPVHVLRDLEPLRHLEKLEYIYMDADGSVDLEALSQLPRLRVLELVNMEVRNLAALSESPTLTRLTLESVELDDPASLGSLSSLSVLEVRNVPVGDIAPLTSLDGIWHLRLNQAGIHDLTSVRTWLHPPHRLDLSQNEITDLRVLVENPNLPRLTTSLDVTHNCLDVGEGSAARGQMDELRDGTFGYIGIDYVPQAVESDRCKGSILDNTGDGSRRSGDSDTAYGGIGSRQTALVEITAVWVEGSLKVFLPDVTDAYRWYIELSPLPSSFEQFPSEMTKSQLPSSGLAPPDQTNSEPMSARRMRTVKLMLDGDVREAFIPDIVSLETGADYQVVAWALPKIPDGIDAASVPPLATGRAVHVTVPNLIEILRRQFGND